MTQKYHEFVTHCESGFIISAEVMPSAVINRTTFSYDDEIYDLHLRDVLLEPLF